MWAANPNTPVGNGKIKKKKRRKEGRKINGRNDVDFGQEKGQSLGIHVV